MTLTLDASTIALLAKAAQSGGGRHAFRVRDEELREAAKSLAASARKERKSAARKQRRLDIAADMAALRAFNGYDPRNLCERSEHNDDCCNYGALIGLWKEAPKYRTLKRMARELFARTGDDIDRDRLPEDWRNVVRRYIATREAIAFSGSFAISRDDMRADNRSRFFKRVSYRLSTMDYVPVTASAEDVLQDAFVSALESDGLTFGTMFRHVSAAAVSAAWRYQRMGNRHSENVREWTWQDWQAWAAANDGSDRLAYSTDAEWQAFDVARTAHNAAEAHVRFVAERRAAETASLDETRQAWATLIAQGFTVSRICKMLGRNPETVLSELTSESMLPARLV